MHTGNARHLGDSSLSGFKLFRIGNWVKRKRRNLVSELQDIGLKLDCGYSSTGGSNGLKPLHDLKRRSLQLFRHTSTEWQWSKLWLHGGVSFMSSGFDAWSLRRLSIKTISGAENVHYPGPYMNKCYLRFQLYDYHSIDYYHINMSTTKQFTVNYKLVIWKVSWLIQCQS